MVGRGLKQAIIGTALFGVLATLMGCTSLLPKSEPTPVAAKPQPKVVQTTTTSQVAKPKKVAAKKIVTPVAEEPPPPVVAPVLGGSGGGGGGW
ncbi:MAG: hypothetical protein EOS41_03600 [Mesorhizobium sp.]|nr:hypothetical protein CK216_20680 [Mesorhizobium sp. WSM3876]RWE27292.1 MAG: hypothetical protein EOS41_03600 [Mesorhizobium sp.]TGT54425.1 hypothetical protein EN813_043405 [Mesorhizobium sp. M00.F.Ca.ET.170.01.1.1]